MDWGGRGEVGVEGVERVEGVEGERKISRQAPFSPSSTSFLPVSLCFISFPFLPFVTVYFLSLIPFFFYCKGTKK